MRKEVTIARMRRELEDMFVEKKVHDGISALGCIFSMRDEVFYGYLTMSNVYEFMYNDTDWCSRSFQSDNSVPVL